MVGHPCIDPAVIANRSETPVIGNVDGNTLIPAMIHDGKPRITALTLFPGTIEAVEDEKGRRLISHVTFDATYRVDDHNAIQFGAMQAKLAPEEFLASGMAKDAVKDGQGENPLGFNGSLVFELVADPDGQMKINDLNTTIRFKTDAFSNYAPA